MYKRFSKNLRIARKLRRVTQAELAAAVGVSRNTVSSWENGVTEPNLTALKAISDYLDVSLDDLFGR